MSYNYRFIWTICITAALGGLLFGYDWVVIGGAKPFFVAYYQLEDASVIGWAMSSALVGCIAGAIGSFLFSDTFGRKSLLLIAGLLFVISAIGTGLANNFSSFVIYRILGGIGIGLASSLSPMYISEVSPPEKRGQFVSINQLTIVIGVLLAQVVNWLIALGMPDGMSQQELVHSWYGQNGWRWMFAAEAIPAGMFAIAMLFVPESPRWLIKNGKYDLAIKTLERVGGFEYAKREKEEILKTISKEDAKVSYSHLLNPRLFKVLVIGSMLAILQQWSGINVIFYYAEDVFKAAGYEISGIMFNIIITGLVNLFFTFLAISLVDRVGRKPLIIVGFTILSITYLILGALFYYDIKGPVILTLIMVAIGAYAMSLAPITWVLISEIFPNRIRGAAMSISVLVLWFSSWLLTQTFPTINGALGASGSFWIFGIICFTGLIFVLKSVPETKGKSLEAIEKELFP